MRVKVGWLLSSSISVDELGVKSISIDQSFRTDGLGV